MEPFLGEIRMFPWDWAPKGWAQCNGALLGIPQYTALYSLIGTYFGGNGTSTFALPDLRGRVPVHRSTTNGTYSQGAVGGTETVTLTQGTMPAHNHALLGSTSVADKNIPTNVTLATHTGNTNAYYGADFSVVALNPASVSSVGSGVPHENMQPFNVVGYCIALQGLYPSRN